MEYRDTEFHSAHDKEKFEAELKAFVEGGYKYEDFSKNLYDKLSINSFGHIAHYNQDGFFVTQFSTPEKIEAWESRVTYWLAYGNPRFTFSDVEKAISEWMGKRLGLVVEEHERQMRLG